MADIILKSEGFTIGNLEFESFFLEGGAYASIDFSRPLNFEIEQTLIEILTGVMDTDKVFIGEVIAPVKTPYLKSKLSFLVKKSAFNYLKQYTPYSIEKIINILKDINIEPKLNIYRLGENEKKLLSLEVAYSKSKHIVINTSGLDYNGIEKVRERVRKEMNRGGSLIEINYLNSRGREYLFNENERVCKRITIKSY